MTLPARLDIESPRGRRSVAIEPAWRHERLTEVLRGLGLPLNTRCAQRGLCDGCLIELQTGRLVRACAYRLEDEATARIRIPARSLLAHAPQVITDFKINIPRAHQPLCADAAAGQLGVAIDVGTTTVALLLVDLADGTILARAGGANRQAGLGDDVLTRINLCMTDPAMLGRLQTLIVERTVRPLLARALREAGASADGVACITVAGNTTMLHLLAGVDPSAMGVAPFTPTFLEYRSLDTHTVDLLAVESGSGARIHLLPGAAAYVGADVCAGAVASGLAYDDGPCLLVDIGTNGEILLAYEGRILGCATAAGPAFEGAGLRCGVRAADGAIAHVRLATNPVAVHVDVIGGTHPTGLCGSAYVDFLAEGRRTGLLSAVGRFDSAGGADGRLQRASDSGLAFRIVDGDGGSDIVVTESDIARLLQAKAAIAAGILTLLGRAGVTPAQVDRLYVAGGFGMHLDVASAIASGLLPGFLPAQVHVMGNTSLAGAYLALLDAGALEQMKRVGRRIETVELNLDPQFETHYIEQLALPEPTAVEPRAACAEAVSRAAGALERIDAR